MTDIVEFVDRLREAAISHTRSAGQAHRQEIERPIPEHDCGKQGHLFTLLCDLDKIPRLARCSECHREWAFGMVLEVNRIP